MKIDLSVRVGKETLKMIGLETKAMEQDIDKAGHIGTHFDVMDKQFCIDTIITTGKILDISELHTDEVKSSDLDLSIVEKGDFIIFYTGILKKYQYGTKQYFSTYIELSDELVDTLIAKQVSFIGVDMAGIKKPADHPRIDQHCADHGIFVIENLNQLEEVLTEANGMPFRLYTFPVHLEGFSGLPCRIVAEVV